MVFCYKNCYIVILQICSVVHLILQVFKYKDPKEILEPIT